MTKAMCEKIMKTANILVLPIASAIAVWVDFDAAVYSTAIVGAIDGVLQCVEVFLKK